MLKCLLFIGVVLYLAMGSLTDDYLNDGCWNWTNILIMFFWPIVLLILSIVIVIKDAKKKRRW